MPSINGNPMRCGTCGSTDIRTNRNAGDWDFPWRCFGCNPPPGVEPSVQPKRGFFAGFMDFFR